MPSRLPLLTLLLALPLAASEPLPARECSRAVDHLLAQRQPLGLDLQTGFRVVRSHQDDLGQTHVRVQSHIDGIPVVGSEAILRLNGDGVDLHTDALVRSLRLATQPTLGAEEARYLAFMDQQPLGPYSTEPQVTLVILPQIERLIRPRRSPDRDLGALDLEAQVTGARLVWHVATDVACDAETSSWNYYIDAHTGRILEKWNDLHTADAKGQGQSQYSGTVPLSTNSVTGGFETRDTTRGTSGTWGANVTSNMNNKTDFLGTSKGTIFTDADNAWGDGMQYISGGSTTNANGQTAAVDAHFGMQATWDYFKLVHGRNGIDGKGKATYSRVHYGSNYENAFWKDACFCMTYGDGGNTLKTLTALDVAAHEMSHGVCANSAKLKYSGESGGLNEANSDIFAAMVEFHARGGSGSTIGETGGTWTVGEQVFKTAGRSLRYMYKPSLDGKSPDAWSSTLSKLDVHYSSGPMNRCFYFLSQGASSQSTADTYSSYLPQGMAGVGNDKAARIWYRALTVYMTSSTNYAGARTACLKAATDLYGAGSVEYTAVTNAFKAINVQ